MDYGFYDPDYGFCFSLYDNSLKKHTFAMK